MGIVIDRTVPPGQGRLTPLIVGERHGIIRLDIIAIGGGAHTVPDDLQRVEPGVGIPGRAQVWTVGAVEIIYCTGSRSRGSGGRVDG